MEPEVHLIEKYFQEVMHCFTMSNIRCKGGKEIDLIAICPQRKNEKFHVEARVSTAFKLKSEATYTKHGKCHKNGVDYFGKEKFCHPTIVGKVRSLLNAENYCRVLVVWDVEDDEVLERASAYPLNIEIWFMSDLIEELLKHLRLNEKRGFRDDILRTFELIGLYEKIRFEAKIKKTRRKSLLQKYLERRKDLLG